MKSMSEQFDEILAPRLDRVQEVAGKKFAESIAEKMKENTDRGVGFGADEYNSTYSKSHARVRRRKGLQVQRVDLRMSRRRIEQTRVTTTKGGAGSSAISFQEGGQIFKMHHDGSAKGGKTRSIFPKTPDSVPDDMKVKAKKDVLGVLSGKNS